MIGQRLGIAAVPIKIAQLRYATLIQGEIPHDQTLGNQHTRQQ
ncbi:hypothetical protein [Dyella lipolytica]|nr:hypothetical protein [Dyella lipolytica]